MQQRNDSSLNQEIQPIENNNNLFADLKNEEQIAGERLYSQFKYLRKHNRRSLNRLFCDLSSLNQENITSRLQRLADYNKAYIDIYRKNLPGVQYKGEGNNGIEISTYLNNIITRHLNTLAQCNQKDADLLYRRALVKHRKVICLRILKGVAFFGLYVLSIIGFSISAPLLMYGGISGMIYMIGRWWHRTGIPGSIKRLLSAFTLYERSNIRREDLPIPFLEPLRNFMVKRHKEDKKLRDFQEKDFANRRSSASDTQEKERLPAININNGATAQKSQRNLSDRSSVVYPRADDVFFPSQGKFNSDITAQAEESDQKSGSIHFGN
ncbi:MAG: hypothetical protein H2069_02440 [Legionella sp.]|nr:hypothetical protein [Legionella sp.]